MGAAKSMQCDGGGCKCHQLAKDCDETCDDSPDTPREVVPVNNCVRHSEKLFNTGEPSHAIGGVRPHFDAMPVRVREVQIVRVGENWRKLGLLVSPDPDPRYLVVDDVWEPSLVSEWNDRHPQVLHIKAGDVIASVNGGGRNGEEMLSMIQASGQGDSLLLRIF
mmetsp:Transcript_34411/g.97762  ORF Transcript_34411/g.97762 Transcript_34411/m.97762 type:complete len:164 (-) Transcript_34411:111-602(-)